MFCLRLMLFPTLKKKQLVLKKNSGGGGGGGVLTIFFLENQFFLISFRVLCYFQHYKKILKSAPSLTG